jgi:hypothetical protein
MAQSASKLRSISNKGKVLFIVRAWIIRMIFKDVSGPRIVAAMGEGLGVDVGLPNLWKRREETVVGAEIRSM